MLRDKIDGTTPYSPNGWAKLAQISGGSSPALEDTGARGIFEFHQKKKETAFCRKRKFLNLQKGPKICMKIYNTSASRMQSGAP